MRKIVAGLVYDTDSAEELAEANSGLPASDFRHWYETLYRTAKGAYFLVGGGGPMSRWARHIGNESHGDKGLRVLNETEAREWVERHANAAYERIFGKAQEA